MDRGEEIEECILSEIETHLGARLSAAYLVHYDLPSTPKTEDRPPRGRVSSEGVRPRRDDTRLPRDDVRSVWRVTNTGREQLSPEAAKSIETGAIQDDRFENAVFSLWAEVTEGVAYVERIFGPLHGGLDKYRVHVEGNAIDLRHEKRLLDY